MDQETRLFAHFFFWPCSCSHSLSYSRWPRGPAVQASSQCWAGLQAEAEWEVAKAAPQDTQSELALSEQPLLGGRRHWVSQALCGPSQLPSKSCSPHPNLSLDFTSQSSHWSIQDTSLHRFPFMTIPFSHSDPTPGQLQQCNPWGLTVSGQSTYGPTTTHLQTSQQAAPGGFVVSVFPLLHHQVQRGSPVQAGSFTAWSRRGWEPSVLLVVKPYWHNSGEQG